MINNFTPKRNNIFVLINENITSKFKFFLFSLFLQSNLFGQYFVNYCFDTLVSGCGPYTYSANFTSLEIDTISNPNNIWQIGVPQKTLFDSAFSLPNVIITDTINTYPNNDTSSFIVKVVPESPIIDVIYHHLMFSFDFYVDSDTLTDFGKIEFSPDCGSIWVDITHDPNYANLVTFEVLSENQTQYYGSPRLSGMSGGWLSARTILDNLILFSNFLPIDSLAVRFSFISDGIQTNREGLMIDNISIGNGSQLSIEEKQPFPNRTLLQILDLMGRETEDRPNVPLIYVYSDGTREKVFRVE